MPGIKWLPEALADVDRLHEFVKAQHPEAAATRAWKGHDWAAMDRLHHKGFIGNPKGKSKSVVITEEGRARAEQLFAQLFKKAR